jgi:hypothetical protein
LIETVILFPNAIPRESPLVGENSDEALYRNVAKHNSGRATSDRKLVLGEKLNNP